jgi:hypothetical protein
LISVAQFQGEMLKRNGAIHSLRNWQELWILESSLFLRSIFYSSSTARN